MTTFLLFQQQAPPIAANPWITITLILLALSLITERIANLIKLHIPAVRLKSFDPSLEKKRERRVIWISIVCGLIVASGAYADLFFLIEEGALATLTSHPVTIQSILGVFLCGLLVSLGSKFWHDVLDIVLQFSNLKKYKALGEGQLVRDKINDLTDYTRDALKKKAEMYQHRLETIHEYEGYRIVTYSYGESVIQLYLSALPAEEDNMTFLASLQAGEFELIYSSQSELNDN